MHLFYFWLNSADLAIGRVASRVKKGGHHVPEKTIRQRYGRSIRNLFELYIPVVSSWKVYDNSLGGEPVAVAEGVLASAATIHEVEIWSRVKRSAENG